MPKSRSMNLYFIEKHGEFCLDERLAALYLFVGHRLCGRIPGSATDLVWGFDCVQVTRNVCVLCQNVRIVSMKRWEGICIHFYHPQRSCGKVMFSRILSRGVCIPACTGADIPLGRHPPARTHWFMLNTTQNVKCERVHYTNRIIYEAVTSRWVHREVNVYIVTVRNTVAER